MTDGANGLSLPLLARLTSPAGAHALALAARATADNASPLAAASAVRAAGVEPELAAAALTQVGLRGRAVAKFGPAAAAMWFTRTGLEQATRAVVAHRRAARLVAAGVSTVADLGCGIGADTIAFARAGIRVQAVEADPVTAAVAAANVAALDLSDLVEVRVGDATAVDLSGVDAAFCDPARRSGGRRVFDPAAYSPPWPFVVGLFGRSPVTVLKVAPGIDHRLIPPGAEAEWISVDGDLVEAALWGGRPATVARRATVLRGVAVACLTGSGDQEAPVGPLRPYVHEPDPAVVRSHLVAEFAATMEGTLADPHIAYVFSDTPTTSPYGRCFAIREQLPYRLKNLRSALRERGIGQLEILKRGVEVDPALLRRDLHLTGPTAATLVLARLGDRPTALLCDPVPR